MGAAAICMSFACHLHVVCMSFAYQRAPLTFGPSANQRSYPVVRFYSVLPSFSAFYLVLLGFLGYDWVLLGFTGSCLVLPSFTGFYLVLLDITRFLPVLTDFIGFYVFSNGLYWILPGLT